MRVRSLGKARVGLGGKGTSVGIVQMPTIERLSRASGQRSAEQTMGDSSDVCCAPLRTLFAIRSFRRLSASDVSELRRKQVGSSSSVTNSKHSATVISRNQLKRCTYIRRRKYSQRSNTAESRNSDARTQCFNVGPRPGGCHIQ